MLEKEEKTSEMTSEVIEREDGEKEESKKTDGSSSSSKPLSKEDQQLDFSEDLNKRLENPVFSVKVVDFSSRPSTIFNRVLKREEAPFDLYQVSESWIKVRSSKTKKTWLIERDTFVKRATEAVLKFSTSALAGEAAEALVPHAKKAAKKDELLKGAGLKVLPLDRMAWSQEELEAKIQDYVWDALANSTWSSQLENKVADPGATLNFISTVIAPRSLDASSAADNSKLAFKMLDPEALETAQVKIDKQPASFETSGDLDSETGAIIWRRALDPIIWFGREVKESPSKLEDYDKKEVALVAPTKELEEASLQEDEAFGYAI